MKKQLGIMALLLASVSLPALAEQVLPGNATNEAAKSSHQGTGKVISIDREKLKVKLEHGPIASLNWPGMTMDFAVIRAGLLDKLQPGAQITFRLVPGDAPGRWVIDQISQK